MDRAQLAVTPAHSAQPDPRRWWALVLLCTANFMVILDSQVVILAIPTISTRLQLSQSAAQWVLTANLVTFGGLLLLGGRAADLLGRRKMFLLGTLLFLLVSLASGFAWNGEVLILARALHGVSAALMTPTALSLLTAMFPEGRERHLALAGWAGIAGIGATVGLLVGGGLTSGFGWQGVFFVNVPVAVLMLIAIPLVLRESRDLRQSRNYDLAGAVTSTAVLALIVYTLAQAPEVGWLNAKTLATAGAAVVLAALFVVIELRSSAPLLPLRLLGSRVLVGGNLAMVTMGMCAFGMSLAIAQYTQGVLGYSPLEFGLKQSIMPLMAFVGSYAGQSFITRFGFRPVAAVCLVLIGAGSALLMYSVAGGGSYASLFVALFVFGCGLGLGTVAASAAALAGVAESELGLASGINTAAQQIGGGFGIAIVSTVLVSFSAGATPIAAATAGFRATFAACVIFAAVGLVIAVTMLGRRQRTAITGLAGAHVPLPPR
ncbi:MFS transporter [Dactylosporangium sp. NPDC051484]|uniref:MFS transporter n=1 Tax=Dactylosporangium sp. NPDC051484 TaxID=3154942 RepID=UPI00344E320A